MPHLGGSWRRSKASMFHGIWVCLVLRVALFWLYELSESPANKIAHQYESNRWNASLLTSGAGNCRDMRKLRRRTHQQSVWTMVTYMRALWRCTGPFHRFTCCQINQGPALVAKKPSKESSLTKSPISFHDCWKDNTANKNGPKLLACH